MVQSDWDWDETKTPAYSPIAWKSLKNYRRNEEGVRTIFKLIRVDERRMLHSTKYRVCSVTIRVLCSFASTVLSSLHILHKKESTHFEIFRSPLVTLFNQKCISRHSFQPPSRPQLLSQHQQAKPSQANASPSASHQPTRRKWSINSRPMRLSQISLSVSTPESR